MSGYNVEHKNSGVLGITCRETYEGDSGPTNCAGGGCSWPRGRPQAGLNSGSPGMSPGWNPSQGMPQPWNMSQGMPQPWNTSQGMTQPWNTSQGMTQPWNPITGVPAPWNPIAGGWESCPGAPFCEPHTGSSSSSISSSSSSSDTASTATGKDKSKEAVINPMVSPWYNYEFCTCEAPLPDAYVPKPKPKKKPPVAGPRAGIWCGSPCCAVTEYFPPKGKDITRNPLQLKLKEPSSAVPPGTCCFRNDQLIFQVPNKGNKGNSEVMPFYSVGQDEKPLGVKMMRPDDNPEMDPDNNTYIIKITKTDAKGKPAKMQLALKIPRPPDASVPENETSAQYSPEDYAIPRVSVRKGSRKSNVGRKSKKSVAWSTKRTTKRIIRRSTKASKASRTTKSSKVKFSGAKRLVKEIKKKAK